MYSFSNISNLYVSLETQSMARYLQERERERESSNRQYKQKERYAMCRVFVCTHVNKWTYSPVKLYYSHSCICNAVFFIRHYLPVNRC